MSQKSAPALGKSLMQKKRKDRSKFSTNHSSDLKDGYDWGCLQSITEQNQLDEFMLMAEKSATEYAAEKMNIVFVHSASNVSVPSEEEEQMIIDLHQKYKAGLQIPRRPCWDKSTSPDELREKEKETFLEWRRRLAVIEKVNDLLLTPFEKNLEFWRQLWRVVERSNIVVQVIDARNPLLFRCEDLEQYVKEVDESKMNMLLLNKADLLTEEQRCHWEEYFVRVGIAVIFYSAKEQQEESSETESEEHSNSAENSKQPGKILSRPELINYIRNIRNTRFPEEDIITFGLVGYPNVGKSSTINTLLDSKKVSVSATPGKTKHFQTLFLETDICLCDCPGLVMPSFAVSKADLLLNGVLSIDHMVDHRPAVDIILTRIPRHILESTYGIHFPPTTEDGSVNITPTVEQFLNAHGYMRGFMTQRGLPNNSRSARYILKDYVQGKLLYCHSPPDLGQEEFQKFPPSFSHSVVPNFTPQELKINKDKVTVQELDEAFSKQVLVEAHAKGLKLEGGLTKRIDPSSCESGINVKPWKKQKKMKKEKLRIKFSHLDQ